MARLKHGGSGACSTSLRRKSVAVRFVETDTQNKLANLKAFLAREEATQTSTIGRELVYI
ncbi:hypothetical protein D3870_00705 [Noviherbaspirillum cavernae]|uniref:Uncharacterized protein n=1 Tax=Noviherbaspirillum cavernae TaxID=2320862 RepID=A0A418WX93_9BURK|nr:hypothetical protein D3870_00705 [Noviherbaspirillum cavernae]